MEEDIREEGMMVDLEPSLTEKTMEKIWGTVCMLVFIYTGFLVPPLDSLTRQDGSSLDFCLNFVRISCYFFLN